MPKSLRYLLPLITALLLVLSFPRWDQGYLAWAALLPLFYFCQVETSWKGSFWGGLLGGLVFFAWINWYLIYSLDFFIPRIYGILALLGISLYFSLFFGLFTLGLFFILRQPSPFLQALLSPSLWVFLEYLRASGPLGHSGGFLGFSQGIYPFILPTTALYGYWGLSFLMVMFQALLFVFMKETGIERGVRVPSPGRGVGASLLIFITLLVSGLFLPSLFTPEKREESLRFALIQGNLHHQRILSSKQALDNFNHYLALSARAREEHGPLDMIVFPELVLNRHTALLYPQSYQMASQKARELDTPLLMGSFYQGEGGQEYNSIIFLEPDKSLEEKEMYHKIRLVPFSEGLGIPTPVKEFFDLRVNLGNYTPGEEVTVFELGEVSFGGIICFESYFPRPSLQALRKGGEHIFILTNNALFLDSNGLEQHARAAAIRAAEMGAGFTQVANTGYTISYNYRGEKVLKLPTWEEGYGLLETNFARRVTLYRLLGDYFVFLCGLLLIGGTFKIYQSFDQ